MSASSENELVQRLSGQGLRILSIGGAPSGAPGRVREPERLSPGPVAGAPARNVVAAVPRAVEASAGEATPGLRRSAAPPVRTRRASYRDLMFLFAQMSTLLRSGISPADSCTRLSTNVSKAHIRAALAEMAKMTAQGHSLADSMAVYPDIFPDGAVGAVRAGETGGYTWEACDTLRGQYEGSHKMAWGARLFRWAALFGLLGLPMVVALTQGLDHSFATMGGFPALVEGTGQAMKGWTGVWFFGLWSAYLLAAWWGRKTEQRALRHRLVMKIPFFAQRAKAEALSAFAWHLGKISTGGTSPSTAWKLAAEAVPNEELGRAYATVGSGTTDSSRMAEIVRRTDLVPHDYASIIETGEMTGTLPQALEHTSRMAGDERRVADGRAKFSLYGAYILLFVVISIIASVTFYSGYVNSLLKHTVGEAEEGR